MGTCCSGVPAVGKVVERSTRPVLPVPLHTEGGEALVEVM